MVEVVAAGACEAWVDLWWLPLGAGDTTGCVRWNGRCYEAAMARREHRAPCDLYHSALQVRLGAERFVIEMAPASAAGEVDHGVVGAGAVGHPWFGKSRLFRYEVRRWRDGSIPDAAAAVKSPVRVSSSGQLARRVLDLVAVCPTATWGRDELHTGDMWNSNSLTAWLLARSGHDTDPVSPPGRGRAPGWSAGLVVAARQNSIDREAAARCERHLRRTANARPREPLAARQVVAS